MADLKYIIKSECNIH